METVLNESILALTFNHLRSSIIYLAQPSFQGENPINELIELDLHNQTVLERYIISKQLPNQPPFTLITSKRKGLLILTFQPSQMEIWQLGNSAQGFNQSIWSGETKGRSGYEIQHADVSNLDGTFFFSAVNQRNIYCANIEDTISSNSSELNISKSRLPENINIYDLKCHPTDYKVCAACSDGLVRIWNQNTSTELKSLQDEQTHILSIAFQQDGQKLVCGCDKGKILCYDAKTLGNRNILLAVYNFENTSPILTLNWISFNGANNCNQFLSYQYDGNIKLLAIKLLVPQDIIRDQKVTKSKNQELFGTIKELQSLISVKNDIKYNTLKQQPNVGLSKFIQIHPYANFISINSIKTIQDQTILGQVFFQYFNQIILLNDASNLLLEYTVCQQSYQYSFQELLPNDKNQILLQRYLYYIDQHSMEIKQYCIAKGVLQTIANLKQMILVDNPVFYQLQIRPNTLYFTQRTQFLLSYKIETTYRCCTVMLNEGVLSDNLKEFPARFSMYLGSDQWANPPLFLLYEDKQSYSIIFEDTLPKEEEMLQLLNKQDKDKLQNSIKQSLNLKVQRMFYTPLRSGFVVVYQPQGENVLKFSRNRNPENNLLDLLMQSGSEMIFRLHQEDQITDLVWQKDDNIGAVVTIHDVYIVNDSLTTLKVISLQPQVNNKNRILLTYWIAQTLILQTKFHILYVLLNGQCASIQSIDGYEEKNVLSALLWDRIVILCQSYQKRSNNIEIKIKSINLFQPILQGYIHNQRFFNIPIEEKTIIKLIQTFANPNIDYSLVKDLEQYNFISCAKHILQLDDCHQFTKNQKAKFFINTFDFQNLNNTLFDNQEIIHNDDLKLQLIRKINDKRYEYLRILLEQAKQFYTLSYNYKLAAEIDSILNKKPDFIISILLKQGDFPNIENYNTKIYDNHEESIKLSNQVKNQHSQYFKDNIKNLINLLIEQQQIIKEQNFSEMKPSYYFTDYLLDKLKAIQSIKQIETSTEFLQVKFKLVYEDKPNDDDDEEQIINGKIIREFDIPDYDQIIFFLGVGGQPQAQKVKENINNNNNMDIKQEMDVGVDDDEKEFQDLLIYWRIDEGEGNQLEDLGNYECQGEIYINKEIATDTENLWDKLEDGEPMEQEDKWGRKCDQQQCGLKLEPGIGFQTKKKNYWKKRKIDFFSFEIWLYPQQPTGQILQVGTEIYLLLRDQIIEVYIQGQLIKFIIETNDEDNPLTQPILKLNLWNHICLTYEQSASSLSLYIQAKYSFIKNDLDIPHDIFKDKHLMFGEVSSQQILKCPILKCEITEFRFWKQKFELGEIRDGYRAPLAIVIEKKKKIKIKMKKKDKSKQNPVIDGFNAFKGMILQLEEPEEINNNKNIVQQNETQEFKQEENQVDDGQNIQQSQQEFGWFNTQQQQEKDTQQQQQQQQQQFQSTFEFENNGFNEFAQVAMPQTAQQMEWGSDFGNFGFDQDQKKIVISSQTLKEEKTNELLSQQHQQPVSLPPELQKQQIKNQQKSENLSKIDTKTVDNTIQGPISPQKNSIQEIQQIVDQAIKFFGQGQTGQGVNNLTKAFEKLNEYLQGDPNKFNKIQKFIIHCGQYRFAFQLMIGIKQMYQSANKKKELFLHLILIHQNIIPSQKVTWILKTIHKCIEYENSALAETLQIQLKQSLDKVKLSEEDRKIFEECDKKLQNITDKKNNTLMRMTCPNCKNHFHFKGIKKCNKCNKDFALCQITLACIQKEKCLHCKACESVFSEQAKKIGDQCPNCKLEVLQS